MLIHAISLPLSLDIGPGLFDIVHFNLAISNVQITEWSVPKGVLEDVEKVNKQIDEYEREVLYPLATKRIEIDLDDGVAPALARTSIKHCQ